MKERDFTFELYISVTIYPYRLSVGNSNDKFDMTFIDFLWFGSCLVHSIYYLYLYYQPKSKFGTM